MNRLSEIKEQNTNLSVIFTKGQKHTEVHMNSENKDYKKLILELIDKADKLQLRQLYHFIKGFLGLG